VIALLLGFDQNSWGYVGITYSIAIAVLLAYTVWVIWRGRRVSRQLPPDERRWM